MQKTTSKSNEPFSKWLGFKMLVIFNQFYRPSADSTNESWASVESQWSVDSIRLDDSGKAVGYVQTVSPD